MYCHIHWHDEICIFMTSFYQIKTEHILLPRHKNIQLVIFFSYHNYYNLKPSTIYTADHLGVDFYILKLLVYPKMESAAHHRILISLNFSSLIINNMLPKTIETCLLLLYHLAAIAIFPITLNQSFRLAENIYFHPRNVTSRFMKNEIL